MTGRVNIQALALALALCFGAPLGAAAEGSKPRVTAPKPYTTDHLVKILRQAGYVDIAAESDQQIRFKRNGRIFYLNRYEDGDLVLYFGLTGYEGIGVDDVNAWNRQKRMTRAYIDAERDPVLESDLLFDGGLTTRKIAVWVNVFVDLVAGFEAFLNERDQSDTHPASPSTGA